MSPPYGLPLQTSRARGGSFTFTDEYSPSRSADPQKIKGMAFGPSESEFGVLVPAGMRRGRHNVAGPVRILVTAHLGARGASVQSLMKFVLTVVPLALGVSAALQAPANSPINIQTLAANSNIAPCLQAAGNYDGAAVTVVNCATSTYAQRTWVVVNGGAEENTSNAGSATQIRIYGNKCLDVKDGIDQDGTKLQIWTCYDGSINQLWQVNGAGDISWSGHSKCMELTDGSTSDGTLIQIWTCYSGNTNQLWNAISPRPASVCSGGKVGLAWAPNLSSSFIPNAATDKTCYIYDWSSWPPSTTLPQGLKFVPMFWGPGHEADWTSNVIQGATNYGIAMGMQEVNQAGGANMTPAQGAQSWKDMLVPLRTNKNYQLVSPSVTSASSGIPWLQSFMSLLTDSEKPDFMAVHWYGKTLLDMQNYLTTFHNAFPGKTVWVTEFACEGFDGTGCTDDISYFANGADDWLSSQSWIGAYFPFGFASDLHGVGEGNRLMNASSGLVTPVGWAYLS
ncbi:hypothetical protein FRC20_000975 [Serendipita sp. 405]|nr:hypothetical protein FRC20_000975 [Serendipita sp. 405]